jgi:hypothetical protein
MPSPKIALPKLDSPSGKLNTVTTLQKEISLLSAESNPKNNYFI